MYAPCVSVSHWVGEHYVWDSTGDKLTLVQTLQLHSTILSASTVMSRCSKGLSTLTARVTAPQWHEP